MPPDDFRGFPNSPQCPQSFFFSPQTEPSHPYVKSIWRRLSPRCSTGGALQKWRFWRFSPDQTPASSTRMTGGADARNSLSRIAPPEGIKGAES